MNRENDEGRNVIVRDPKRFDLVRKCWDHRLISLNCSLLIAGCLSNRFLVKRLIMNLPARQRRNMMRLKLQASSGYGQNGNK